MDTHQTELYKCRLQVCMGEATALQALHSGVSYLSDDFNRTLSPAERESPTQLDTCRNGHTGRLCQVLSLFPWSPASVMSCDIAHRLLATTHSRVLHENTQACKPGYTVQGMYCTKCDATADPAVKMVAARFVTVFIVLVFGSWCVRPYFAKTEAKIRRMASEQGARLGSRISKQLGTFREKVAIDVQMQVRSTQLVSASCPCQAVSMMGQRRPHCCVHRLSAERNVFSCLMHRCVVHKPDALMRVANCGSNVATYRLLVVEAPQP